MIDTGVDAQHDSIKDHLWKNPGESGFDKNNQNKANNGVDDDHNGFVDDVNGWNFVKGDNNVLDDHGHGTHITGIIIKQLEEHFQRTGDYPKVKIMVLRYFSDDSSGADHMSHTISAIIYATKMGAHIINYSAGGLRANIAELAAIKKSSKKGILFVAAVNNSLRLLEESNFGKKLVHVAAPGKDIYSTLPNNQFGIMSGTSQATAHVTGALAMYLATRRKLRSTASQKSVKSLLKQIGRY